MSDYLDNMPGVKERLAEIGRKQEQTQKFVSNPYVPKLKSGGIGSKIDEGQVANNEGNAFEPGLQGEAKTLRQGLTNGQKIGKEMFPTYNMPGKIANDYSYGNVPSGERQVPSAERQVPSAEKQVTSGERQVTSAEEQVPSAESQVTGAESNVQGSESQVTGDKGEVTGDKGEVPSAESNVPSAESQVTSAESQGVSADDVELAKGLEGHKANIAMLEARVAAIKRKTPEQIKAEERKERSRRIISALSDGLRSLGNLFYTTKYAPDMYKGSTRQLDKVNAIIEKARQEREKENDNYYNFSLQLNKEKTAAAAAERAIKDAQLAREIKMKEEKRKEDMHPAAKALAAGKVEEQGHKTTKAANDAERSGYERDIKKTQSEYEAQQQQAAIEVKKAQKGAYNASAANSMASAKRNSAAASKIYNDMKGDYVIWTDNNGGKHKLYDSELEDLYTRSDDSIKSIYRQKDGYNNKKTPTKEEQRLVAIEQLQTIGDPRREKRPSPTGGGTGN